MVEIFKTNVQKETDANYIIAAIKREFPTYKVNFDLEDCDKILRVEGIALDCQNLMESVNCVGYMCVKLD